MKLKLKFFRKSCRIKKANGLFKKTSFGIQKTIMSLYGVKKTKCECSLRQRGLGCWVHHLRQRLLFRWLLDICLIIDDASISLIMHALSYGVVIVKEHSNEIFAFL